MTILPTDQIPEEHFWQDKADLENVRAGAYQLLAQSGQTDKILLWGEVRSDNLALNDMSQTNVSYLQDAILQPNLAMFDWSGFYTGINYCNLIMEQGESMTKPGNEVDPSFTRSDYKAIRAEMMALRSLYYFYLVRAYRDVPFITESIRTDEQARNDYPAAMPGVAILGACIDSVEANLSFAVENYGSESKNKGQFTKKSLHALLADMYLWRACMLKNF
ncbi:MAG: RagB/SusD family nutrient uptake outer membrane protein, partial [Bacteroidales bacterium]|nr:RagB/SusD family nutrient uptake outer membrane protein [Bacteroidales bacterium]